MRCRLHLKNLYYHHLRTVPFTYGVPIPEGAALSVADIALLDARERPAPLAVQALARWADGSVRWALLDFCGDFAPNEEACWQLAIGEGLASPAPANPVCVREEGGTIVVANGPLEAEFSAGRFNLLARLVADGQAIVDRGCRGDIVAISPAGKIYRASYDPAPRLSLEEVSPLRAVVRWDGGLYAGDGTRMTEYRLKLTFYAGNPYVRVEHAAVCREMPERGVMIREYRIDLDTLLDPATEKIVRQKNHGVDNFSRLVALRQNVRLVVPTDRPDAPADASAGILGAVGKVMIEDESAFAEHAGDFPHFLQPGAPRVTLGGGYAVVFPFLGLRDTRRTVVGSFLRMAPQHPKGLHADEGRMSFEVWPAGFGEWRLSRGMTKTHHLAWSFFGRTLAAEEVDAEALRRECFAGYVPQDPVEITLDPACARQAGEVEAGRLLPCLPGRYPKLETKIAGIELHGKPLASAGMMDWGEAISTNNEEDQGYEYAMEYYRSGSYVNYLKCVQQMLHNATVDIVDWDPDPLRMGAAPYHTHYHQDAVCVPSHNWTEGLFAYACMTGDREAHRAAIGVCEWILRFMDGKPLLVQQDGREIGWPIIALVAGYRATWDQRYRDAAYRLVDYYRERMARYGDLCNTEPPGTGYQLIPYGEYTAYEGMHKLWQVTGDEELRAFALRCIETALEKGHISYHGHGRMMDLYALYAAYDMSGAARWVDEARRALPVALARPDWNGYFYRRIMHFLGMCHQLGLLDDALVALKD